MKNFILSFFLIILGSQSSHAELYLPFFHTNPDRLDIVEGYCKNPKEELKVWTSIYKFTGSVLAEIPAIPPEQIKYIENELSSENMDRRLAVHRNSFYRMRNIYTSLENLNKLAEFYITNKNNLKLSKKIEIIGRSMLNLRLDFSIDEAKNLSQNLHSKDYQISEHQLSTISANFFGLERVLVLSLICYGENNF